MENIPEYEGRAGFGLSVGEYDRSRPDYPNWFFELMAQHQVLLPESEILEIGAGNGLASKKLIERGVSRLTLVEPEHRFAPLLTKITAPISDSCQIIYEPFEEAELTASSFDLIVAATSYHWLDPLERVGRLANLAKIGGAVVLMWNVFQDMNLSDSFHEATKPMLEHLASSPSGMPDALPFALDQAARVAEFTSSGCFELLLYAQSHWKLSLNSHDVRSLYKGFSNISRLPVAARDELLDRLETVASVEFDEHVERNMTSPIYIFRRV